MNISPHFSLSEFTASQTAVRRGIDNTPSPAALENIVRTAQLLESVRELFNKPIRISSGFRSLNLNRAIGSKDNSQHVRGCAADFTVIGVELDKVMDYIIVNKLPYDQLIREFNSWIHISVPNMPWIAPRREALIIDKKGARPWHSPY